MTTTPEQARLARLAEEARAAIDEATTLGFEGDEADKWIGRRITMECSLIELERQREATSKNPRLYDQPGWEPVQPGTDKWLYKIETQKADSSFTYRVEVRRRLPGTERWAELGKDYVNTRWGARRRARALVRTHIRRFGTES